MEGKMMRRNRNKKFRIRRRRKRTMYSMLNSKPYTLRQGIVTLGPGTTVSRITLIYNYTPEAPFSAVVNIMQDAQTEEEFTRYVNLFHYYKLIGLKLIIPPRIAEYTQDDITGRIAVDWTSQSVENVIRDDSAKEIAAYSTRYQVYRFAPPNVTLSDNINKRINYKDWISTKDQITLPGSLKITSNFKFKFTIEVIMIFKGNQTERTLSIKEIGGQVNMLSLKEEVKEDKKNEKKKDDSIEEVKNDEEIKEEKSNVKKSDSEEDVWNRDPLLDRKPRWSNEKKQTIKLMKALENKLNNLEVKEASYSESEVQ